MAEPIARLAGTMIAPGVSRNRRGYSAALLADAYERLRERITRSAEPGSGVNPVAIYTSHGAAGDDASEKIVGRVDSVSLAPDGAIHYEASLADSSLGRDVLALVDTSDGAPAFLRGVSIRGAWEGDVVPTELDGVPCEAGSALDILGLDLTGSPGVPQAEITTVTRTPAGKRSSESDGRTLIYESAAEARVTITETAPEALAPTVWAAPGNYHPDGRPRLPLDTRGQAMEAWRALGTETVCENYSAAQLRRCRARTRKALEGHGISVTTDGWLRTAGPLAESVVAEYWPGEIANRCGGFEVSLHVGPLRVTVVGYDIDPHDVDRIARAAAAAASGALAAVQADPDAVEPTPLEGGTTPPWMADDEDDEDGDEPAESALPADQLTTEHQTPAATEAAGHIEEEPAVADTSSTAPEAAAQAAAETDEQRIERIVAERVAAEQAKAAEAARIEALVAERLAAAEKAAAPQETEEARIERLVAEKLAAAQGAASAQESEEQRIQRLVDARVTAAIQSHAERGGVPQRTGLMPTQGNTATESAAPAAAAAALPTLPRGGKDLHLLTEAEKLEMARYTEFAVMGRRSAALRG